MPEVETGIPLPPKGQGRKRCKHFYPWDDVPVGGSFFVPHNNEVPLSRQQSSLTSLAKIAGRIRGTTYATRQVDGGIRVWRVA
jgi:hypothetical protein